MAAEYAPCLGGLGDAQPRPRQCVAVSTPPLQAEGRIGAGAGGEVPSTDDPRRQARPRSLPRQPDLGRDVDSFASGMRILGKFPRHRKSIAQPGSHGLSPRKSFRDGSRLLEERRSTQHRRRVRNRILGTVLVGLGILVWVITATLPFTHFYARFVLLGHRELLSLGVVAGGGFVIAGIIRIGTSVR